MVGDDDSGPNELEMIWILRGMFSDGLSQECAMPTV